MALQTTTRKRDKEMQYSEGQYCHLLELRMLELDDMSLETELPEER